LGSAAGITGIVVLLLFPPASTAAQGTSEWELAPFVGISRSANAMSYRAMTERTGVAVASTQGAFNLGGRYGEPSVLRGGVSSCVAATVSSGVPRPNGSARGCAL
jgi:hypothetical protein